VPATEIERKGICGHRSLLLDDECAVEDGIPVTSPFRTIFDLAAVAPMREVELDSRSVHGTKKRFESDRQRDRILTADGWRILHFTWRALHDEPDEVIADLRAALGQGHHPRPPGK